MFWSKFLQNQLNVTKKKTKTTNKGSLPVKSESKIERSFQEKEYNFTMAFRKSEHELKQKEFEMQNHRSDDQGALNLENGNHKLDARDSGFDDWAALSIRSRSPFNCESPTWKISVLF